MTIRLEADVAGAVEELSRVTRLSEPQILGRLTRAIGTEVQRFVKSKIGSFKNTSGKLKKGISRSKVSRDGAVCYVYSKASRDGARYPFMIPHDYTIQPKDSPFLAFQVGGKWIRTKKVLHKGRAWMPSQGEIDAYLSSGGTQAAIQAVLAREYRKLGVEL